MEKVVTTVGHLEYEFTEKEAKIRTKTGAMMELWEEIRGLGCREDSVVPTEKADYIMSKLRKIFPPSPIDQS